MDMLNQPFTERIRTLLEPVLQELGFEMISVQYFKKKAGRLDITIDRLDQSQVTMKDCVSATRAISVHLDVHDPIEEKYTLNVNSPGPNRPLEKPEHYQRFVGYTIEVTTHASFEGQRRFQGTLEKADAQDFILVHEKDQNLRHITFTYDEVRMAHLVPSEEIYRALLKKKKT